MSAAAAAWPAPATDALAGRVVLVTGAAGGLGSEAAKACAAAGANVVLLGRKLPRLNKVYDAVKALGPEPALYPLDLAGAGPADYAEMAERIADRLGGIDGVLHCAADFAGLRPLENTPAEDFVRQLHVGLTAPWLLTRACLPWLRQRGDAAVVFVLDDLERVGKAYWGAYGLAQHGLGALARMLHAETDASAVRVSALRPGPMPTTLRGRAYVDPQAGEGTHPARVAQACVHLLSAAGAGWRGREFAPGLPA
jgi:NAD(P)-dependent dehydrogenase (short-subunit alcohol dehydrogenase family)